MDVIRYFPGARAGLPFVRSHQPGFTLFCVSEQINISTGGEGWTAEVHDEIIFPMGLEDDGFLHVRHYLKTIPVNQSLMYRLARG